MTIQLRWYQSNKLPVLDRFSDVKPLMGVIPPMKMLSCTCLIPEQLDSSRNVKYKSETENDLERELEGDSENDFDKVF